MSESVIFGYYYSESKTKVALCNTDLSHSIKDFIMFSEITSSPFTKKELMVHVDFVTFSAISCQE